MHWSTRMDERLCLLDDVLTVITWLIIDRTWSRVFARVLLFSDGIIKGKKRKENNGQSVASYVLEQYNNRLCCSIINRNEYSGTSRTTGLVSVSQIFVAVLTFLRSFTRISEAEILYRENFENYPPAIWCRARSHMCVAIRNHRKSLIFFFFFF